MWCSYPHSRLPTAGLTTRDESEPVPDPLPNVPDLVGAFTSDSDAYAIVSAFLLDDLEQSRRALRALVAEWEDEAKN